MPNLLTASTLPDVVYHYCSVDTFFQIITNHTLRLSDIEKSNDFMEKKWAIRQCLEHIRNNLTTPAYSCSKQPELAAALLAGMEQQFQRYNTMILAACFSSERGITEPTPTFSACFGQAFLELHPTKYAEELVKKMKMSGAKAYLVNTGWNGSGKRISIKDTRGIIDAILNGDIKTAPTKTIPYFNFEVPTELPGVDSGILDPRDTYADASEWDAKAKDLAGRFIKNFAKYEGNEAGKALVAAGPQL